MSPRVFIGIIAAALIIGGFIVLSLGSSYRADTIFVEGLTDTVECGSALNPAEQWHPDREAACADKLQGKRIGGWALVVVGALAAAGAAFVRSRSATQQPAPEASDATPDAQP